MAEMQFNSDDPDLAEKAKQFFLDNYRETYYRYLSLSPDSNTSSSNKKGEKFELSVDKYPKDVISEASVRYLLKTHHLLKETLKRIPPKNVSAEGAAVIQIRRTMLAFARTLLYRLIFFLMMDARVTVNKLKIQANGDQLLKFDIGFQESFVEMTKAAILCNVIFSGTPVNAMFAEELSILSNSIAVFFSTFDNIYDIKAIRKCRIGFEEYLQSFGTTDALAAAENCLRRLKTMYLEITKPKEAPKPAPQDDDKLKAIEAQYAALSDKMEKMSQSIGARRISSRN